MAEMPSGPTIDPRLRDYLDAELRLAEADFARLPRPTGRSSRGRAPLVTLLAAAVVLVVAVIAGSQLLGRSVVGPAGPSSAPIGSRALVPSPTAAASAVPGASSSLAAMTPEAFWSGLFSGDAAAVNYPSLAAMAKDSDLIVLGSFQGVAPGPVSDAGSGMTNYTMTVTLNVERVLGGDLRGAATVPVSVFLGVDSSALTSPYAEVIASRTASMPAERGVFFLQNVVAYYSRFDPTAAQRYDPTLYQVTSLQGLVRDNAGTAWVTSQAPGTWAPELGGKPFDTVVATLAAAAQNVPPASPAATGPTIDCGRISAAPCEQAIALARAGHEADLVNTTAIVVDDTCAPTVACDRSYPFDSIVVFVTAGADTTGWYAYEVTGLKDSKPTNAEPLTAGIPSHIAARLAALLQSAPTRAPAASASAATPSGPTLECGDNGVPFRASALDGEPQLTGPDPAIAALRALLAAGADPGMPSDGWRTVAASEAMVEFLARGATGWWSVIVASDGVGGWQESGSGECRLAVSLPTTLTYAMWRLDPKHPPTPGATTVTVLATELACANGEPPGSRLQTPAVVETGTSVTITLLVRKLGSADCPSNPEIRVVVQLKAPLGSRPILDGSTYPATDR